MYLILAIKHETTARATTIKSTGADARKNFNGSLARRANIYRPPSFAFTICKMCTRAEICTKLRISKDTGRRKDLVLLNKNESVLFLFREFFPPKRLFVSSGH